MTPEQQRALALARARRRRQEAEAAPAPAASTPQEGAKRPANAGPPRIYDTGGFDPMGMPTGMTDVAPTEGGYSGMAASAGRTADDAVRMIANGMTFGLADKAAGAADALTGQADSYDAGVRAQRAQTQQVRDERPVLATVSELAGGIATGGGLAANGLTLAGRVGSGLVPRILAFGAEGAAYGAAQGAGNTYSDDINDYLANGGTGAMWGGGIGGALPVAGGAVSLLARGGQAVAGPTIEGAGRTASAFLRGAAQADEAGLRALPSLGDEGMLVDAGPAMLGLGQGAGTGLGPGRSALVNSLRERDAATVPRLNAMLDETLGPAPIPSRVEAGLTENRRVLGPAYDEVLADARAVDPTPLAERLDALAVNTRGPARTAAETVRSMLNVHGTDVLDPHPGAMHQTRQAIDGMLRSEQDGNVIRILKGARQEIDDILQSSVPGIKEIDGQYRELSRQSEALERGAGVFDNGRNVVVRPAELDEQLAAGVVPQGRMIGPSAETFRTRQGGRAEIDRLVGTNANDLNVLERTLATPQDWNSQKFAALFGEPEFDTVAQAIAGNRRMRQSYQDIVQGAQTAQRTAAQRSLDGELEIPMDTSATGLALNSTRAIARALLGSSREQTKDEIGEILSRRGPEAQRIAEILLGQAVRSNANAALARALIANPANASAGGQYGGRPATR